MSLSQVDCKGGTDISTPATQGWTVGPKEAETGQAVQERLGVWVRAQVQGAHSQPWLLHVPAVPLSNTGLFNFVSLREEIAHVDMKIDCRVPPGSQKSPGVETLDFSLLMLLSP